MPFPESSCHLQILVVLSGSKARYKRMYVPLLSDSIPTKCKFPVKSLSLFRICFCFLLMFQFLKYKETDQIVPHMRQDICMLLALGMLIRRAAAPTILSSVNSQLATSTEVLVLLEDSCDFWRYANHCWALALNHVCDVSQLSVFLRWEVEAGAFSYAHSTRVTDTLYQSDSDNQVYFLRAL